MRLNSKERVPLAFRSGWIRLGVEPRIIPRNHKEKPGLPRSDDRLPKGYGNLRIFTRDGS